MMHSDSNASFFTSIFSRELLGRQALKRPFLQDLTCEGECSGTIICNASTVRNSPVFGLQYSQYYNKLLAIGDEDGYVSIVNTSKALPAALEDESSPNRPLAQWTAHRNAIFDLSWANLDRWVYTASGDMTISQWDTGYASKICSFTGHGGSVKSLSVSPNGPEVFATGARDGMLMLWDARMGACTCTNIRENTRHPMMHVSEPHAPETPRATSGRRRSALQGRPRPSVTAVQFIDTGTGHMLCSGGVDGKVKFWDVRYAVKPTSTLPPEPLADAADTLARNLTFTNRNASFRHLADGAHPKLGERNHAVTSLALHPDGCQLLVSHTGGHHLLYDVTAPEKGPIRWFGGHTVASFYIKAAFSPDGSHFVSGSSDAGAYIWQVNDSDGTRPYILRGHESEVTTAAWCRTDIGQIATAADDYTVKVWNIHRQQPAEQRDVPAAWAGRRQCKTWTPPDMRTVDVGAAAATGAGAGAAASGIETGEAAAMPVRQGAELVTPVPPAAAEAVQLAQQTSVAVPRGQLTNSTGQLRISNALRIAADRPMRKRTKQQTIAEALFAAQAKDKGNSLLDDVTATAGQKRPRSACSDSDELESRVSQDENAPVNMQ